jgi:hypothetical protein
MTGLLAFNDGIQRRYVPPVPEDVPGSYLQDLYWDDGSAEILNPNTIP